MERVCVLLEEINIFCPDYQISKILQKYISRKGGSFFEECI